ncbi:MAG TPA: RHS repeat-associated core domain-containing protein [Roseateles sp.]
MTTSWKVDDFGRVTRETRADGTSTVSAYCTLASAGLDTSANSSTANGDPKSCPSVSGEAPSDAVAFVHTEPWNSADQKIGPFVRVYKDRLGRDLRSVTESFDGADQASGKKGVAVYKDAVYNDYGVKTIETQAYFAGSTSSTTSGSSDVGLSLTVVDVLGRPTHVHVADPNGLGGNKDIGSFGSRRVATTTIDYQGLSVTTTNDKGQTRKEDKNALGELVRVTDASGATLIHQRDAFGNLHKTKDALGNVTTLTYDQRGRKTQLEDPDTGTWKYAYDALGQLVWQQSPKQLAESTSNTVVQTTMAYDVLGRMTSRGEPEFISTWQYDKNANGTACMAGGTDRGIGKLCQSGTSAGVSRQYVYDSLGRPTSSRTNVTNGPSFASSVEYDALGRVIKQTYPTGVQVGYSYTSGLGFLEKLLLNTPATVSPLPNASGQTAAGTTLAAGSTLWQAKIVGAWGKVEQQSYGNGIVGTAAFEAATGRITKLTAGASNNVLSQKYTWDSLSNLQGRDDDNGDGNTGAVTETFTYGDSLNRLTSYTVAPAVANLARTVNLHYNALGMLLYKSDVGNYTYNAQGGAAGSKPHALQSVAGVLNTSYTYDDNGNLATASAGKYRSVSYTSFNLPDGGNGLQGPDGLPKYTWQYDESHARIKEVRQDVSGSRTTWYLHPDNQGGLGFESETAPNGTVSNRHYLSAGGQVIGVLVKTGALPTLTANQTEPTALTTVTFVKVEYWHKDHLGSLITTTDHAGAVTARYAYDPFGKRRYTSGTYDPFGALIVDWVNTQNAGTDRGYTGHEHLDDVGIVHMNGRLYDPNLGVMMQPDPIIGRPADLQNYNRYGYCFNNPLTCTDPSGYDSWSDFRHAFVDMWHFMWRDPNFRTIAAVVVAYVTYGYGSEWAAQLLANSASASAATAGYSAAVINTVSAVGGATVSGFSSSMVMTGGDVNASLRSGAIAGLGAGLFGIVGANFSAGSIGSYAGHGAVGCLSAVISDDSCGRGAASQIFSKYASVNWSADIITASVVGGTVSAIGGGKFANGAITGAFGYLFNACGNKKCFEFGAKYVEQYYRDGSGDELVVQMSEIEDLLQDPGVTWAPTKNPNRFVLSTFGRDGVGELSRGRVLGDITVERVSDGSFRVLRDYYNFEQHDNPNNNLRTGVRNAITASAGERVGPGTSFFIRFEGTFRPTNPLVLKLTKPR